MKFKDLFKINLRGTREFIFYCECDSLFDYLEKKTNLNYKYIESKFTNKNAEYCGDIPF